METRFFIVAALLFFFIILAGLLFSKFRINIDYLRENKTDNLQVNAGLWFFSYTYRKELSREYFAEKKEEFERKKIRFPGVNNLRKPVSFFLRHARWQKLDAKIVVGLDDAAVTGITVGAIWAAAGGVLSMINRYCKFNGSLPELKVLPDYEQPGLFVSFKVIFFIRVIYLISIALSLVSIAIKHKEAAMHGK